MNSTLFNPVPRPGQMERFVALPLLVDDIPIASSPALREDGWGDITYILHDTQERCRRLYFIQYSHKYNCQARTVHTLSHSNYSTCIANSSECIWSRIYTETEHRVHLMSPRGIFAGMMHVHRIHVLCCATSRRIPALRNDFTIWWVGLGYICMICMIPSPPDAHSAINKSIVFLVSNRTIQSTVGTLSQEASSQIGGIGIRGGLKR